MKSQMSQGLADLRTEQIDPRYSDLDTLSPTELLKAMNEKDIEVPLAVGKSLASIEKAIEGIVARIRDGGRLIYIGAGTSGRLGVLDAAECGPTFSVPPDQVIAVIAGGDTALRFAVEGAEDDKTAGVRDLQTIELNSKDAVVGIAASGRTPYVEGAIAYARTVGALTVGLSCNVNSEISIGVDVAIEVDTGPELVAGSTRLKAGTAQKMVLNMITTVSMIQLGKTFGNLMVDLQITNEKLRDRAIRIVEKATSASRDTAATALDSANGEVKVAIVSLLLKSDVKTARSRLESAKGHVRKAVAEA